MVLLPGDGSANKETARPGHAAEGARLHIGCRRPPRPHLSVRRSGSRACCTRGKKRSRSSFVAGARQTAAERTVKPTVTGRTVTECSSHHAHTRAGEPLRPKGVFSASAHRATCARTNCGDRTTWTRCDVGAVVTIAPFEPPSMRGSRDRGASKTSGPGQRLLLRPGPRSPRSRGA